MMNRSSDYRLMRADASSTWGWEMSKRKHTQGGGEEQAILLLFGVPLQRGQEGYLCTDITSISYRGRIKNLARNVLLATGRAAS
jgi:hypothetical protein